MNEITPQAVSFAMGLLPSSPEFKVVERALEIQREFSLKKKGIMCSYPLTSAARYVTTIGGNTNINFYDGKVKLPAGATNTETELQSKMTKCRSLILFCSDADAKIFLDGKQIIYDHTLWHLFEDIEIESLDINFPAGRTPDAFAIGFVASDKPYHSFKNALFISHDIQTSPVVNAGVASVVSMLRHVAGYDTMVLTTRNTDGADSLNLTVEYSSDGVTWFPVATYNPKTIAFGVTDELDILVKYHFLRASVIRTAAADATMQQILQCAR